VQQGIGLDFGRMRSRMRKSEAGGGAPADTALDEHRQLWAARLRHRVEVHEPLVLISQIQRSGGSLLSQLFDGHPECHAHPGELQIGHPRVSNWPRIELDAGPECWYEVLAEPKSAKELRRGYRKSGSGSEPEYFPFLFLPTLQQTIFEVCVGARGIESERDVLDCYFTSYFNAWLDNHNLEAAPKRVVTGFAPRLSADPGSLERFFAVYPDGTLVSIVRDPCGWYASARSARAQFNDLDRGLELWHRSAEAAIEAKQRFGDRVLLLTYEDLVLEPERTMSGVAERIGLTFSPVLLEPTFNGWPIRANSTGQVDRYGIVPEGARRYADTLDAGLIVQIKEQTGGVYDRARALVLR
jgi:hypothetical protein